MGWRRFDGVLYSWVLAYACAMKLSNVRSEGIISREAVLLSLRKILMADFFSAGTVSVTSDN